MTLSETLRDELETLEAVHSLRVKRTEELGSRNYTGLNAKLYELSVSIQRITADDVRRKRAELIAATARGY